MGTEGEARAYQSTADLRPTATDWQNKFLLEEYTQLWRVKEAINQRQVQIGKIYLTCIGGLFVATIAVAKLATPIRLLPFAAAAALLAAVVGTYVYVVSVATLLSWVTYVRSINNIRSYFVTRYPECSRHILMPTNFRAPTISGLSVHCMMCSFLASGFYGLCVAVFVLCFGDGPAVNATATVIGATICAITLIVNGIMFRRMKTRHVKSIKSPRARGGRQTEAGF